MSSNNLEGINKKINESITEINNTMEKKKNSLITINKNLNTIKDRIIELKGKLEINKKDINAELEKAKQEAKDNTYLTDMIQKIQGLLENIDLDKNIEELDQQNSAIEKAINDKVKEARDKELPDADQKTKDIAKKLDEAGQQDQPAIINESLEDSQLQEIFKGESDEVREVVNKVSRQFNTKPGLYNTFKEELIKEYNKQKPNGRLNKEDIDKLINQGVIPTLKKNGVPVLDKDGNRIPIEGESPMKAMKLSNVPQGQERIKNISKRSQEAQETRKQLDKGKKGGKRTRKRRRNSRKKKVVKRR